MDGYQYTPKDSGQSSDASSKSILQRTFTQILSDRDPEKAAQYRMSKEIVA